MKKINKVEQIHDQHFLKLFQNKERNIEQWECLDTLIKLSTLPVVLKNWTMRMLRYNK